MTLNLHCGICDNLCGPDKLTCKRPTCQEAFYKWLTDEGGRTPFAGTPNTTPRGGSPVRPSEVKSCFLTRYNWCFESGSAPMVKKSKYQAETLFCSLECIALFNLSLEEDYRLEITPGMITQGIQDKAKERLKTLMPARPS